MKRTIASDFYGTLVDKNTIVYFHPNAKVFLEKADSDIIICSVEHPKVSEQICNRLGIKIVGAYCPGSIKPQEDIFIGALRVYKEMQKHMQRYNQNPSAYITDKNLEAVLCAHVFGKTLYCGL